MISPIKIAYNGKSNQSFPTFNLLCDLAFDGDNGETATGLNRSIISTESYNGKFKYATGAKYNEVLSPKITLIKEDYTDLTLSEQRQILSWLTNRNTPGFMDVYYGDDDSAIVYSMLGMPIQIDTYKLANNRTVGITFTFESLSPFAFSPLHTEERNITSPTVFNIVSYSDDTDSLVYPKITVTPLGKVITIDSESFFHNNYIDGTVYKYNDKFYWKNGNESLTGQSSDTSNITTTGIYIINETTGEMATYLGNIGTDEIITIDGANKIIASSNSERVLSSNFSWRWLGLKSGLNKIKVVGNCKVTFEWRDYIKPGQF